MIFPDDFKRYWKQPGVKAAFVDPPPEQANGCANCGGRGFMATFVATVGPLKDVPGTFGKVAHYAAEAWWIGELFTADCPVCRGKPQ
jgi:hypothetical protein